MGRKVWPTLVLTPNKGFGGFCFGLLFQPKLLGNLLGLWMPSSKLPEGPSTIRRLQHMARIQLVLAPFLPWKVLCRGCQSLRINLSPEAQEICIWSSSLAPNRVPLASWTTGVIRSIFHPDEACLSGSLGSFRMRDWSSGRLRHNWRFRTYILTSPPLARGEGLEIELITNGQWLHQSYQCKEASTEA